MSASVRRTFADAEQPGASAWDTTQDSSDMCVLLLLDERPATAGEVRFRLRRLGLIADDADLEGDGVHATLQALARRGLVDVGTAVGRDPGAHVYRLSAEGTEHLSNAADDLRSTQILLDRFLARCSERREP